MMVSEPASSSLRAAPKKRFGRVERDGVDAAGERPAGRRQGQVVGARQARDGVQQDDHVAAGLDLALGDLERHLGHPGVVLGRLVEGGADDLALDRAAHVGDLLRALADERDHEQDLRVVGGDAVGDALEQHRLAGLGRADDERALALADGVDEVDQALAEVLGVRLEVDELDGVDGRQGIEVRPALGGLGIDAVDRLDAQQAPVLLAFLGRAADARHAVAGAQAEAAHLAGADVDVVRAGHEAATAHEAEAILDDVQDAGGELLAAALDLALEDPLDEGVLAHVVGARDLQVAADLDQLADVLALQLIDVHGHQDGPRWGSRVRLRGTRSGMRWARPYSPMHHGIRGSRAGMSCGPGRKITAWEWVRGTRR